MIEFNRFSETFEDDSVDGIIAMGGAITVVDTMTDPSTITASEGDFYAILGTGGTYSTLLDGERDLADGADKSFATSVDIYIDDAFTTGDVFNYSVEINTDGGSLYYSYVFNGDGALRLGVEAGQFGSAQTLDDNNSVTLAGDDWYTLEHVFTEAADGSLLVTFSVYNSNGILVLNETISELEIDYDTEFQGNGSAQFDLVTIDDQFDGANSGLAIDNFQLNTSDDNPVQILVDGVIVDSAETIGAAKAIINAGGFTTAVISSEQGADDDFYFVGVGMSIQDALDEAAMAGNPDKVEVAGTSFDETVTINASVTLTSGGGTVLDPTMQGANGTIEVANGVTDVSIDGFTIVGGEDSAAIYFAGANTGVSLTNNTLTAAGDHALDAAGAVTGAVIDGNTFNGQTFNGTAMDNGPDAGTDDPAVLINLVGDDIEFLNNVLDAQTSGNDITPADPEVDEPLFATPLVITGDNAEIDGNTFTGNDIGLGDMTTPVITAGANTTVTDNVFDNTVGSGDLFLTLTSENVTDGNSFLGGDAADVITGLGGDDIINSGDEDDDIAAGTGANQVDAGAGDDTVTAGDDGNDLSGGAGEDSLTSGAGDDVINGDEGDDQIDSGAGDDVDMGGAGDDVIVSGAGTDVLDGGDGSDTVDYSGETGDILLQLEGNPFSSIVSGDGFATATDTGTDGLTSIENVLSGSGADILLGSSADNAISGGANNDFLSGIDGNDMLDGEDGDDEIFGGAGDDVLLGGLGLDILSGGEGNDDLSGEEGNDELTGGDGLDTLAGGDDDDILTGNAGDDEVFGQAGMDMVLGGDGNDIVSGGDDNDTVFGNTGNDEVTGGMGNDTVDGGDGDDVVTGNEGDDAVDGRLGNDIVFGGSGTDVVNGGNDDDTVSGGEDNDQVFGGTGNDEVDGGNGDDTVAAGDGDDRMSGAAGNDEVYGGAGNDTMSGGDGDDLLAGNADDDEIFGGAGNDTIFGGTGADLIAGNADEDEIFGGTGNDTIFGGTGADTLLGGDGDDLLYGNQAADLLDGGAGNDTMFGGADADLFLASVGADVIADFDGNGGDVIDLSAFSAFGEFADVLLAGENVGDDYVINLGDGNSLTLNNVNEAELLDSFFAYAP